jgi:hypothetical protein
MQLRYDEDFVESAVFVCATGKRAGISPMLVRRFHIERERLYKILDPDERNDAFFKLHLEWFREWGLEKFLSKVLSDFPLLAGKLDVLAFRKTRVKNEEGSELYVSASGRNGVIALRPERFAVDEALIALLNHELTHLQDMVDPAFGYSRDLNVPGLDPSQQRLTRERYRLLWDATIDGRLSKANKPAGGTREIRWAEFDRAYSFWSEDKRREIFESLWTQTAPCHAEMLAIAADPRDLAHSEGPLPGAPCPLCGFPAFQWAGAGTLSSSVTAKIQAEFSGWLPEHGACSRCAEIYEVLDKMAGPVALLNSGA